MRAVRAHARRARDVAGLIGPFRVAAGVGAGSFIAVFVGVAAAQPPTTPVPLPAGPPGPSVRATAPAPSDTGARRFDGQPLVACRGQTIHEVVVDANPPLGNQRVPRRLKGLERRITALHATTRETVVRRFLLLREGDPCDELRRSESERVLRAQPFLVDARVRPYADSAGGVTLLVSTRDEFSLLFSLAAFTGGAAPPVSTVRLGEANLMGQGIYASGEWYWGGVGYRDGYLARLVDYQFLGKPYQLSVIGERRDIGGQWAADLSHPFYTDLQRTGWRTSAGDAAQYLELIRPGGIANALFYGRRYANVGGIVRLGVPGRLSLVGASASFERTSTADRTRVLSDTGSVPDGAGPPLGFAPSARFPGRTRPPQRAVGRAERSVSTRLGIRRAHGHAGRAPRLSGERPVWAQRSRVPLARRRLLRLGGRVRGRRRRSVISRGGNAERGTPG